MARETRPVIAINEQTGERKQFDSVYAAGKGLKASHTQVLICMALGTAVYGWKVYDTPENIRKRIQTLEETIKYLNS